MVPAKLCVPTLTNDRTVENHKGTYKRIRAYSPAAALRELQRTVEIFKVCRCQGGHCSFEDTRLWPPARGGMAPVSSAP